jgi:hypothetical protein
MVINQPLVAHGVGGQDVDELLRLGGTVDQSNLMVYDQPDLLVLRPPLILARITSRR